MTKSEKKIWQAVIESEVLVLTHLAMHVNRNNEFIVDLHFFGGGSQSAILSIKNLSDYMNLQAKPFFRVNFRLFVDDYWSAEDYKESKRNIETAKTALIKCLYGQMEEEKESCIHEEHEDGHCLNCGKPIEMTYEYEHDSRDMER